MFGEEDGVVEEAASTDAEGAFSLLLGDSLLFLWGDSASEDEEVEDEDEEAVILW